MATDVLVSARIPQVKKDAAKTVLASIDATTSDLINSAFDYLLDKGSLPKTVRSAQPTMDDFDRYVERSSIAVNWNDELADGNYRDFMRESKRADYESLA